MERRLAEERRLTRHVGAGNHPDVLARRVQTNVVGDVGLVVWKALLDDGVAASLYRPSS